MFPDFMVIGAMKGGTTSLWHYLKSHPQIYMPSKKEIHFFSYPENLAKGLSWYKQHFEDVPPGAVAIGEASTSYAKYPLIEGVPARIAEVLPDVRLVYVLRHPIERMRSHYVARHEAGEENASIEAALLSDERYLSISRYALQIERYLEFFDREQMLVITSEALRDQREATIRRIFEFLGVDAEWESPVFSESFYRAEEKRRYVPAAQRLRRSAGIKTLARLAPKPVKDFNRRVATRSTRPSKVSISDDLRSRLEGVLRDDVRRLRGHVSHQFDGWGIA